MRQSLTVYGCGGCGGNIVQHFVDIPDDHDKPLFPKTTLTMLDTSDSNLAKTGKKINHFIVPGLEGAGKHRTRAYEGVESQIMGILNDHKPSPFNIVVFSGSGGSGSVIGPLITAELLRRGLATIAVVVGSTTSAIETDNTHKTLRSLQSMATSNKTGGRPICMVYLENDTTRKTAEYAGARTQIDLRIAEVIRQLAMLFGGMHRELDRTDLNNWLNWRPAFPDIPAQLVEILVFKEDALETTEAYKGMVIGTASVVNGDDDPIPDLDQPYSCVGYYTELTKSFAEGIPNHYYLITAMRIHGIFRKLEERLAAYKVAKNELMAADMAGGMISGDKDTGIVL